MESSRSGEKLLRNRVWMRADGTLPDDQIWHVAAMCYASDTTVLDSIITTHGLSWGIDRLFAATVNHSMWFHREFRFDEWMLYATESPVAAGSRGIGSGRFFTLDGTLATSVVQEALIRYFRPELTRPTAPGFATWSRTTIPTCRRSRHCRSSRRCQRRRAPVAAAAVAGPGPYLARRTWQQKTRTLITALTGLSGVL